MPTCSPTSAAAMAWLGEHELAVAAGRDALRLAPHHPEWYAAFAGIALFAARNLRRGHRRRWPRHRRRSATLRPSSPPPMRTSAGRSVAGPPIGRPSSATTAASWRAACFPEGMGCIDWLLAMDPFRLAADARALSRRAAQGRVRMTGAHRALATVRGRWNVGYRDDGRTGAALPPRRGPGAGDGASGRSRCRCSCRPCRRSRQDFGVSAATAQLVFSLSAFSIAVSMLFYGPISDRFGRRPALIGGLVVYLAGSVMCAVAPTIAVLIVGRIVQAAGGCAGIVLTPRDRPRSLQPRPLGDACWPTSPWRWSRHRWWRRRWAACSPTSPAGARCSSPARRWGC